MLLDLNMSQNQRLPDWKGTSRIIWSNLFEQNTSLDEMAQHPVQLDLKCTILENPPVPWGISMADFSHFEKLSFCV